MKLLITGGAGYIGSHMVRHAQEAGYEVSVVDNFSTGNRWSVKDCEVFDIDILDKDKLSKLFKQKSYDGIIHFAAKSIVSESIKSPLDYYQTNCVGSLNILKEMVKSDIENIVFSSTAAIFGNPLTPKVSETHPTKPINPYGKTKLIVEKMLHDFCSSYGINSIALRYFNAAGAHHSAEIGEARKNETHLIPNIINSLLSNNNNILKIFGNDYDTHDGTCIRDYIHVNDLSEAHLKSIKKMESLKGFNALNLGNANGFSVLDVIKSCENVTGMTVNYEFVQRRDGDPAILVADSSKAMKSLDWAPSFNKLDSIVESAWQWHKKN